MNNLTLTLLGGLTPLLIGFIWYSDKVLGRAWKKEIGFVDDGAPPKGLWKIFLFSYLFGVLVMFFMPTLVIHQLHMSSTLNGSEGFRQDGSTVQQFYADFVQNYGTKFRTFKHGVFHGIITAIFFVFPIIGLNALFEKKSFKYIFIHVGYWALTLALMGGLACQYYQIAA